MKKVRYADLQFAISTAISDAKVSVSLSKREQDKMLDCVEITCHVISKVDAPEKIFEIIFNYHDVNNKPVKGEDIIVEVAISDNSTKVINVRYR